MADYIQGSSTIGTIRDLVAFECDQPTPTDYTSVTITDYNKIINRSYKEVVGKLVDSFQDYYINPDQPNPFLFLTDGTNWQYPLPNDFWKGLGCTCYWTPNDITTAITMEAYMSQEINVYQGLGINFVGGPYLAPRYRFTGNLISLQPMPPPANLQIQIRYVPILPDMRDIGTITFTGVQVGDYIQIISSPTGFGNVPYSPLVNGFPVFPTSGPGYQLGTVTYVAIPAGVTPILEPTLREFNVASTDAQTATNFFNCMFPQFPQTPAVPFTTGSYAQDRSAYSVTLQNNVIRFQFYNPMSIFWYTTSHTGLTPQGQPIPANGIQLDPLPVPSWTNPYGTWGNFCNVLNGFDELVAVDASIKVSAKQQKFDDVAAFNVRREAMLARLATEANNRNAGQNSRITNVRGRGYRGGWGTGGFNGFGGF